MVSPPQTGYENILKEFLREKCNPVSVHPEGMPANAVNHKHYWRPIMAFWLFKQEPGCYSLDDLERDGTTIWDGVSNALARKHLRATKAGDRVFFYHTGKEKAIVGEMKIVGKPIIDPEGDDPNAVAVTVRFVKRYAKPITLAEIKKVQALADWDLVRISRLSVVPVTEEQWSLVISH